MVEDPPRTRPNQRLRTRKDLLEAAARLLKAGGQPTLDEIAAEALVSRATAYRYFPGLDALLLEASLDIAAPAPSVLEGSDDAVERLARLDAAFDQMARSNEAVLRAFLAHALTQPCGDHPARQNRRSPLIAAALAPERAGFAPAALDRLEKALALVIGSEGRIALTDVVGLGEDEIATVKQWMIAALVDAARRDKGE